MNIVLFSTVYVLSHLLPCWGSCCCFFNPIQDGSYPVTSTNQSISPKTFLTFNFSLFVTLV